jgi:ABC-type bacteriocin/lantibiotic exporter with double-glycine peptidase domain
MNALRPLQRLQRLLEVDKKDIYQVYIYAFFNGLVNLSLPLGIQAIINLIQGGEISTAWIIMVIFVIAGIVLTGIFQLLQLRIVENIAQKIFSRASFEFAYRIPRLKYEALYDYYAPELVNRFFDTMTLQKGIPKILIDFSLSVFQILVGLVLLSFYHPFFIIFGIASIALVYTIFVFTGPRGLSTSLLESKYKYKVAYWLEEIARTKISFKLIGKCDITLDSTNDKVVDYINARENHFRVLLQQFMHLIGFKFLIATGLLVTGSILVFNEQMNIGQFVAAEIIILLIINSVEKLIKSFDAVYDVLTALEKIGMVTDLPLDPSEGLALDSYKDGISIEVQNLHYMYPDARKNIIQNMNFRIEKNESVVVSGPSGSGKSTLIQLLAGILTPSEGIISFNDTPLTSMNFQEFKKHIGFAISNNQLFHGTIYENIVMGRLDVSLSDVNDSIKTVGLHEFIKTKHDALNSVIDPEGKRIPRSVVNKIILARAIVNRPILLILEDPLDHVPREEKEEIIKRICAEDQPWSVFVTTLDDLWSKYIDRKLIIGADY